MRLRKAEGTPVQLDGIAPIRVLMGWSEGISRSDAVELAKGYIQKRFTSSPEAGWFVVAPFMGGFMWEVQEGGPGISYMPAALEALARDPGGRHWFPCGDRAFQIMMRDGKPFAILLSGADSKAIVESGDQPLMPSGRMNRAVRKGNSMLIAGSAMFGSGFSFLAGAMVFYGLAADPLPQVKDVNLLTAPHAQWGRVSGTTVREVVTKIELKKGNWKIEKRPHVIQDEPIEVAPAPQPVAPAQPPASAIPPQDAAATAANPIQAIPIETIAPASPGTETLPPTVAPVQAQPMPVPIEPTPPQPEAQPIAPTMPEVRPEEFMQRMPEQAPQAIEAIEAKPPEPEAIVLMNAPLPPVRPTELGGSGPQSPITDQQAPAPVSEPMPSHEQGQSAVEPNPVPVAEPVTNLIEPLNLPQAAPPSDAPATSGAVAPAGGKAPAAISADGTASGRSAKAKGEAKRPDAKSKVPAKPKPSAEAKNASGKQE